MLVIVVVVLLELAKTIFVQQQQQQNWPEVSAIDSILATATRGGSQRCPGANNNDYHSFHLQFFPLLFSIIALGSLKAKGEGKGGGQP